MTEEMEGLTMEHFIEYLKTHPFERLLICNGIGIILGVGIFFFIILPWMHKD